MIERIAAAAVPCVIALCAIIILFSKKPMFDIFISGIKQGFDTAVGLFPTLCALMCAVSMFSACGASASLAQLLSRIGIPEGLAGFIIMRPVSGAASTAMLADIFKREGADSIAAISASIMMATSDTLIYIISVYHSAAGIKKSRFTIVAATLAMAVTTCAAITVSRWVV